MGIKQKIIHTLSVDGSIESVFDAITTIEGLSQWWTIDVSGDPEEGGVIQFKFIDVFNPGMKVLALQRPQLVKWKCISGHERWDGSVFTFELKKGDEGTTRVRFIQEYATAVSDHDYGTYNFNWAYYLQSLQDYCETGQGKPFKPVKSV